MKNLNITRVKIFLLLLISLVSFCACGGGSGGGDSTPVITSPSTNPVGTYYLSDFLVKYSDGSTITKQDVQVSGILKLTDTTFSQSVITTIDDTSFPVSSSGTYTVSWSDQEHTAGVLYITTYEGATSSISFTISGISIIIYYPPTALPDSNLTFEEWETWTKSSDSVVSIGTKSVGVTSALHDIPLISGVGSLIYHP